MLSIGEFSRICFVSKKTLRHYDEIGLLRPEHTAENGYRYYTVAQLRSMLLITRLKSYGFSLPEISAVLAGPGGEVLADKLREKQGLLQQQQESAAATLRQMAGDIEKLQRRMDIMEQDMVVKQVQLAPFTVYGLRKHIDVKDFEALFGQFFAELGRKGLQMAGPPMAFYYDEEFNSENSDIEIAAPVAEGTPGAHQVPGGTHCFTMLVGPYGSGPFTAAYAALMKWTEENGYHLCGAPFDKYVRGGPQCPPEEYVTEIYFPIEK